MNKFVASMIAACALGFTPALAADAGPPIIRTPPPVVVVPKPFSWTGHYLGIQGGFDMNHAVNTSDPAEEIEGDLRGPIAGVYGGANWQHGHVVFGIDASINGDWADGVITAIGPVVAGTGEVNWKAFVRGRIGVTMTDRVLLYATGGATWANLKPIFPDGTVQGNPSTSGWTAGGGVEWAHNDHMTMRVDYAYSDYGDFHYPGGIVATMTSHTVMFGLAWKR